MKIYVASSWKNPYQPEVIEVLKRNGFNVYDFRHPAPGNDGFRWDRIDARWEEWSMEEYRTALRSEAAQEGFRRDYEAMEACDACVLLLPCGRSAHTEAGWFAGKGRPVYVLSPVRQEAELMYGLFQDICTNTAELIAALRQTEK